MGQYRSLDGGGCVSQPEVEAAGPSPSPSVPARRSFSRRAASRRASYVTHHIGAWMHRPASILIAPHRDNGKREDNDILIAQVALRI